MAPGRGFCRNLKLNQYDVFVRNENYWAQKPAIKKITFNVIPDPTTRAVAFETGDIDLLYGNEGLLPLDTFARFSQNPAYHTQLSQPIKKILVMLALNTAKAPPTSWQYVKLLITR